MFTLGACATSDNPADTVGGAQIGVAIVGTPADVASNDTVPSGDDDERVVVTTTNGPAGVVGGGVVGDDTTDGKDAANGLSQVVPAASDDDAGVIVNRIDGTSETMSILRSSLTFAIGHNVADLEALVAGGPGAFIVVDTDGVAGRAGVRYVFGADILTEIGVAMSVAQQ